MIIVMVICGVLLTISALLVTVRIVKGPTVLDRVGALDVITSIMVGALCLLAAVTRRADLLAVFVVVAIVGFLGSVAVARFIRPVDQNDPKEMRRLEKANERETTDEEEDESPAHDPDREPPAATRTQPDTVGRAQPDTAGAQEGARP
ncbi:MULTISPECIES: monovalent cation/H+ antiporter complex subunit F [Actinotignum]|uniref:monovalent cation/H+ antiporter complex subunit F n=1 Tax=Actinotignum TaxID=1653174 RepID=UPI002550E659|nr:MULTISPECIES: monovalent cation/H+ antiporter complex subunit F [Actinotignum]MDE1536652.1 monovalent cation/H+ antiporter complex subunit F [Actinotignum schaalii]MDK7271894.1 monovalent cation/H+ antiporter complex subunit F [Actinotignum schaalii]MDY5131642.1 monovalent cation/H+ antiporter complex subunit F [Actinotignum timonense]MDY5144976.1 monovalent cation/H+ antiporter complex subunit F [Actinotignum timonense]MDY5156479.1 monovalent cation/H+ antiporter complex subunit F [Actinot